MPNKIVEDSQHVPNFWTINRIGDETRRPRYFNETLPFTSVVPYRLTRRDVFSSDDVPLHYAASLEVVLYENVVGDVVVDDKHLRIEGNSVVVVPPKIVHGGWVTGKNGVIYCLQISIEAMAHFINIESFLSDGCLSLEDAPETIPEWDCMRALIDVLFTRDDNIFARNIAILSIIEAIARYIRPCDDRTAHLSGTKEELKTLISWTHQNFGSRITLDDAAAVVGFSKHYFCKWFKQRTGLNYIQYVKRVRVYNASKLLLMGQSVCEAGYASGFENMSYFIKCFKEIRGCTPKNYIDSAKLCRNG